ncbi:unnamed protein product [Linum tenue]|uniref:Uncharacterized protein n=1 Tax=Linum tenue TaxID=586396 RepID=A0AAV0L5X3_9ROSI|nr:unnamed protein product [Linum tenue]
MRKVISYYLLEVLLISLLLFPFISINVFYFVEDLSELPSDSLATVNEDEDPALIGALSGLALDSDDDSEDE